MSDDDPVLSPRERAWAPVLLILVVLAAMAIAALPRCEVRRPRALPPPASTPAETGPWRLPVPLGDAAP